MILVLSRFRVANDMEGDARKAFAERPRLVDEAPGFLGLEVLAEKADPRLFVLLTRWTDEASFSAWHEGSADRMAYSGIPEGLKLDPGFTEVRVLEQIPASVKGAAELASCEAAAVLASSLPSSGAVSVVAAGRDGRISWCNRVFEESLQVTPSQLTGDDLLGRLTHEDAERLSAMLKRPGARRERILLNFVAADHEPLSLECQICLGPSKILLVGEPVLHDERLLNSHLLRVTSDLAVALRENERSRRELAAAKEELDRCFWHLEKISDVLPFCMSCQKVKVGNAQWEDVASFLAKNSAFLSHGYCPRCSARLGKEEAIE